MLMCYIFNNFFHLNTKLLSVSKMDSVWGHTHYASKETKHSPHVMHMHYVNPAHRGHFTQNLPELGSELEVIICR